MAAVKDAPTSPESAMTIMTANWNWNHYVRGRDMGHIDYMKRAQLCENFYLGAGRQWDLEDRAQLEAEGRPALEINRILPIINSLLGYQINNRMQANLLPKRTLEDTERAKVTQKVVNQIFEHNQFEWKESEVFADGIIQQRGFYDVRVDFDDQFNGEVTIDVLDPLDVMPDPDAKSYDPKDWRRVIITKWLRYNEIIDLYGRDVVDQISDWENDKGSGTYDFDQLVRNTFGNNGISNQEIYYDEQGNRSMFTFTHFNYGQDPDMCDTNAKKVRVVEHQHKRRTTVKYFVDPDTGDMREVPETWNQQKAKIFATEYGLKVVKRERDKIRWTVTAGHVTLHDDWSPYREFTVVPYFAYFRRGKTISVVDNLISPQQQLNKMSSQALHVANTTANSGWTLEEDSLADGMSVEDLEKYGAKAGVVIVYKRGKQAPAKIQPNRVPGALQAIIDRAGADIPEISGVTPAFQGKTADRIAGSTMGNAQAHSALQVGGPIDNLARTRYLLVHRVLNLVQQFYTNEQIFLIKGVDEKGNQTVEELPVNQPQEDGSILNDLTLGEYSIAIDSVPARATYEASQFAQLMEMRTAGLYIPDDEIMLRSNVGDKKNLADRIKSKLEAGPDPQTQQIALQTATAELKKLYAQIGQIVAQTGKIGAEGARANATVTNNSIKAAHEAALAPDLIPAADKIRAANYKPQMDDGFPPETQDQGNLTEDDQQG